MTKAAKYSKSVKGKAEVIKRLMENEDFQNLINEMDLDMGDISNIIDSQFKYVRRFLDDKKGFNILIPKFGYFIGMLKRIPINLAQSISDRNALLNSQPWAEEFESQNRKIVRDLTAKIENQYHQLDDIMSIPSYKIKFVKAWTTLFVKGNFKNDRYDILEHLRGILEKYNVCISNEEYERYYSYKKGNV